LRTAKLPFFYGWVVIGVTTLAMFATGPGQTFTVAVFIEPVRDELGLSRTAIAAAYSTASLLAAGAIVLFGRAVDRFGGQKTLLAFGLAFGAACLGIGLVWDLGSLTVGFAALRMLGPGAMALAASVLAVQWFVRYRGRAMGVTVLGLAASSAFVPVIALQLIEQVGWRSAWQILGLFVWAAVVLPALIFARDRPERIGLRPDGLSERSPVLTPSAKAKEEAAWTTSAAARTRTFWLLMFVMAVPSLVSTGLIFHQVAYLSGQGLGAQVASVFVAYAITNALSIPLAGIMLDRTGPRLVLFGLLLLLLSAVGLLLLALLVPGAAVVYGLLLGIAVGGGSTAGGVVWAEYYGRRYVGSIRGVEGMVKMLAAAVGPLPLAVAHDQFGSYAPGFLAFALLAGLAAAAALGAHPPAAGGTSTSRPGADAQKPPPH
jgi:MFS family permease